MDFGLFFLCLACALGSWCLRGLWRQAALLLVSLAWWSLVSPYGLVWAFAVLAITWVAASLVTTTPISSRWVWLAGTSIALPLIVFKSLEAAFQNATSFALPLGLSYHTFSCLGYILDLAWGKTRPMALRHLTLMVLFFPKVQAGPVVRAHDFTSNLDSLPDKPLSPAVLHHGLIQIALGLAMKTLVAERLTRLVDLPYQAEVTSSTLTSGLSILLFPWQLYYDFCGYSLIAIGAATMIGIQLPINFDRPLFASSISDFWRRWHISLSSWFQDYVYTPLRFTLRRRRGLAHWLTPLVTFILIGLWHGVGGRFVAFGVMQAVALMFQASSLGATLGRRLSYPAIGALLTFAYIALSLTLIRSPDFKTAGQILYSLTHWNTGDITLVTSVFNKLDFAVVVISVLAIETLSGKGFHLHYAEFNTLKHSSTWLRKFAWAAVITWLLLLGIFNHSAFIYARF